MKWKFLDQVLLFIGANRSVKCTNYKCLDHPNKKSFWAETKKDLFAILAFKAELNVSKFYLLKILR